MTAISAAVGPIFFFGIVSPQKSLQSVPFVRTRGQSRALMQAHALAGCPLLPQDVREIGSGREAPLPTTSVPKFGSDRKCKIIKLQKFENFDKRRSRPHFPPRKRGKATPVGEATRQTRLPGGAPPKRRHTRWRHRSALRVSARMSSAIATSHTPAGATARTLSGFWSWKEGERRCTPG